MPRPWPAASSHPMISALASATVRSPFSDTSALALLTNVPSPMKASGQVSVWTLRGDAVALEPLVGGQLGGDDGQAEAAGELEVALVAGRNGHDRPGAVAHQHVVGDPHRHRLAGGRVGGRGAQRDTGLVPALVLAGLGRAAGRLAAVRLDRGPLGLAGQLVDQGMLGGQHHERRAEQGVGAGGEHLDGPGRGGEPDRGSLRPTDPVALHDLDRLGPVQPVEVVDQAVGVGGDAHHPLAHVPLEDGEVADVGAAVGGDLLVGQDRAQPGAPVHRRIGQVGQSVLVDQLSPLGRAQLRPGPAIGRRAGAGGEGGLQLGDRAGPAGLGVVPGPEDLQEDPLGPAHVGLVGGLDAAPAVVAQPDAPQLAPHGGHVGLGVDPGMDAGGDGVLLGRQPEGVVAQRVQHVVARHAHEAAVDVGADVPQRVADVQAGARGVGEHVHDEQPGPIGHPIEAIGERPDRVGRVEGSGGVPAVLPLGLDPASQVGRVTVDGQVHGGTGGGLAHGCQGSQGVGRPEKRFADRPGPAATVRSAPGADFRATRTRAEG